MGDVRLGSHFHIIGNPACFVKCFLEEFQNICMEAKMPEKTSDKNNGAVKKQGSLWQQKWLTKVMSNGHNAQAKLIFMRIASFGEAGCWMTNETIQGEFHRSEDTVRRAITSLWSKGDIIITGWDGHGRKMYAAGHPKVKPAINALYEQARRSGKVVSVDEFHKKIRLRMRSKSPS
jgi:hypothetical protein